MAAKWKGVLDKSGVAPELTLNDGNKIPTLGLGTWLGVNESGIILPNDDSVQKAVEKALEVGYRLVDTASVYFTEELVGQGIANKIKDGTVKRKDIFVVTKLWNDKHAKSDVVPALKESLSKLGLDYIDLYLIHWPMAYTADQEPQDLDLLDTWKGMEDAKRLGLARSIGVCNFTEAQFERICSNAEIKPAVHQIEVNVNMAQHKLVAQAKSHGATVMAYTPFGSLIRADAESPPPRFDDPELAAIAKKYNKTTVQVVLRYLVERGVIPIPKSVTPERIAENIAVFDFQLSKEDTTVLDGYNKDYRWLLPDFWQDHPEYPFERVAEPSPNPLK